MLFIGRVVGRAFDLQTAYSVQSSAPILFPYLPPPNPSGAITPECNNPWTLPDVTHKKSNRKELETQLSFPF